MRVLPPIALSLALALAASGASGQRLRTPGEVPIEDVLQIVVLDRELVAIDALGGGGPRERLEIGERLLRYAARGRVGIAVTDRRMLAVGVGSGSWQDTRYRQGEIPPRDFLLGDRVALLLTSKRALGFDGGSGNLIELSLGPAETVLGLEIGRNVAVIVTDRRALGLSPFAGGFFSERMRLRERLEAIDASANLATVTTSRRLLTFRSPTGGWEERDRNLR